MAEEKVEKKDFSRYEGLDPKEWSSIAGGNEYKKYLKKADREGRVKELTYVQKEDLKKLKEYESQNPEKEEDEQGYDESAIDFGRIKTAYDIAFYLSYPDWFMSKNNLKIKRFVESEHKEKSIAQIASESREKWEKQNGVSDGNKSKEDSQGKSQEDQTQGKKSLFVRFVDFCKKQNQDWDKGGFDAHGHKPSKELKVSKETGKDIVNKAEDLLKKEGIDDDGVELGDE